jgi:hypothetical protein
MYSPVNSLPEEDIFDELDMNLLTPGSKEQKDYHWLEYEMSPEVQLKRKLDEKLKSARTELGFHREQCLAVEKRISKLKKMRRKLKFTILSSKIPE